MKKKNERKKARIKPSKTPFCNYKSDSSRFTIAKHSAQSN